MKNNNFIKEVSKDYAANVAMKNGITEGELTNKRLPHDAKIMTVTDIKYFISDLESLGPVKCITRNSYAISVQEGVLKNQYLNGYKEINISAEAGLILNPRELDLRIFFKHWKHIFYIEQYRHNQLSKSFHIFNKEGTAILKIYLTKDSDLNVLRTILDKYVSEKQSPAIFENKTDKLINKNEIGEISKEIDAAWRGMKEVHDFYLLMYKYKLSRQEIFRSVGDDLAFRVNHSSLYDVLLQAKESEEELTIFVANSGCVQIYTGGVGRLFCQDDWLNVFNHKNKLHIAYKEIDECWIVRKPGEYGYVTSLEVFGKNGEQIIQLYGQRNEAEPEKESWRNILKSIEKEGSPL